MSGSSQLCELAWVPDITCLVGILILLCTKLALLQLYIYLWDLLMNLHCSLEHFVAQSEPPNPVILHHSIPLARWWWFPWGLSCVLGEHVANSLYWHSSTSFMHLGIAINVWYTTNIEGRDQDSSSSCFSITRLFFPFHSSESKKLYHFNSGFYPASAWPSDLAVQGTKKLFIISTQRTIKNMTSNRYTPP